MAKETLVVYYSRSGTTKRVAGYLAEALGADLELIEEPRSRAGVGGYLRSAFEAVGKRLPSIQTRRDPRDYGLVVVGTPVWFGTMSSPVRAYLVAHAKQLPRAAFFAVMGGRGGDDAVREMQRATGAVSAPTCVLRQDDVEHDRYRDRSDAFLRALRDVQRSTAAAVAEAPRA